MVCEFFVKENLANLRNLSSDSQGMLSTPKNPSSQDLGSNVGKCIQNGFSNIISRVDNDILLYDAIKTTFSWGLYAHFISRSQVIAFYLSRKKVFLSQPCHVGLETCTIQTNNMYLKFLQKINKRKNIKSKLAYLYLSIL